jgi:hypothetical protein
MNIEVTPYSGTPSQPTEAFSPTPPSASPLQHALPSATAGAQGSPGSPAGPAQSPNTAVPDTVVGTAAVGVGVLICPQCAVGIGVMMIVTSPNHHSDLPSLNGEGKQEGGAGRIVGGVMLAGAGKFRLQTRAQPRPAPNKAAQRTPTSQSQTSPVLEMAKQSKHMPGQKNYIPGRSPLKHNDPQGLLAKFAGKGEPVGDVPRGQPGFKERVDFGEVIGEVGGKPTTKGIIHYSKRGAHIVPANPE